MTRKARTLWLPLVAVLWSAPAVRGDVFVLKSGGEVRGTLTNPDEAPRRNYVVETFFGGRVALGVDQVREVVSQRPPQVEYERLKAASADTLADHWRLAEWCRERNLSQERDVHLERMLDFDPEHAEARRILGYVRDKGRWLSRDELMERRGYVKHQGRWRLPQEIEIEKQRDEADRATKRWYANMKLWSVWLDDRGRAGEAEANLRAISDPFAVDALMFYLRNSNDYRHKALYARALVKVGTPAAIHQVAARGVSDPDQEFRLLCLDLLEPIKPPEAVDLYIKALSSKNNVEINRAAYGLSRIGNLSAVPALIDSLMTKHTRVINPAPSGQYSASFGRSSDGGFGPTGLGMNQGPKTVTEMVRNENVLAALTKLTGEDFDYNAEAWKNWYAGQKRPVEFDVRRN